MNVKFKTNHAFITFFSILLALAALFPVVAKVPTELSLATAPPDLQDAVGCLVNSDFVQKDDLTYLGLRVGDFALVRYYVGDIVDPKRSSNEYNIIVYSKNKRKGVLMLALPRKENKFYVVQNAYFLKRSGLKWFVEQGGGGYVDYEAVGQFVTKISQKPSYMVHLIPTNMGCTKTL